MQAPLHAENRRLVVIPARHLEATPAFLRARRVAAETPRPQAAARPGLVDRPRTRAEWIELAVVAICIMMIAGAVVTMIRPDLGDRPPGSEPVEDGYPELRLLAIPSYLAILGLSLAHRRGVLQAVGANLVHLVLPGLAVLSLLWTVNPDLSLRRVVAFVVPAALAICIAARYTERGIVRVLFASMLGCLALSVAYVVLVPSVGIVQNDGSGASRGAFTHKNVLGPVMLHATLFAVAAWLHGIIRGRTLAVLVVAACAMVVGARSVTSLVAFLALAAALPLLALGRVDGKALAAYACISGGLAVAALPFISSLGDVMEAFGRDPSLTGRTPLWGHVLGFAADRTLLGYGYGAFWGGETSPGEVIRALIGWEAPNAHNALLQALGDLGLLGASALLLSWTVAVACACRRAVRARSGADVFPLVALWILFVLNLTESRLLEPNSLDWLIYLLLATSLARVPPGAQPAGQKGAGGPMRLRAGAAGRRPW